MGLVLRGQVVVFVNKPYPRFVLRPPFPLSPVFLQEGRQTQKLWVSILIPAAPAADDHPDRKELPRLPPPTFHNYLKFIMSMDH